MAKRKGPRIDKELEEFRSLMTPPDKFVDGFSWTALVGAIFVALLMVPGSIYMTLLAGVAVGPAAQWVTLILFIEVARRANKVLKRAEIFTLFYLSGAIMVTASMAQGQFHGGLGALWAQFYVQSDAALAQGLTDKIPSWVAPQFDENGNDILATRSLLHWEWWPALALTAFTMLIGRIDNMVLGYGLFRLTSDIEKLPFPMAPVQAQGILALSEEQEEESGRRIKPDDDPEAEPTDAEKTASWRWRVFSIGAMIGLVFGAVYLGVPTITGALLDAPIKILPIPFIDYTQKTSEFLPAVAMAVSVNLGQVFMGMVLPYWAVIGTFAGFVITAVVNPILYDPGIVGLDGVLEPVLVSWNRGDNMQSTFYKNQIDFYFSFSIGVAVAIAVMGFWSVGRAVVAARAKARDMASITSTAMAMNKGVPEGRGDIRVWFIVLVYILSSALYIGVSCWLLFITDGFVYMPLLYIMCFYAFFYTPIISYVTARLEGIAGEVLNIPFVKEACYILSGYNGLAVWFLPVPMHNYGSMTVFYRSCELTGTKFWSIWKSEILLTPIILIGSLGFAHFIWGLGEIPGPAYPFAAEWWEVTAEQNSLIFSSTLDDRFSEFEKAINFNYITAGAVIGMVCFIGFSWLGSPTFLMYGVVKGLNQTLPFTVFGQLVGALIGRYYFQKKLGLKWRQYVPVLFAGFSCGMGLVGTLGVGFTFLAKAVFKLPF